MPSQPPVIIRPDLQATEALHSVTAAPHEEAVHYRRTSRAHDTNDGAIHHGQTRVEGAVDWQLA